MTTLSIQRCFPVCLAGVARTVIDHLETERRCIVGGVTLRLDIFKVQGEFRGQRGQTIHCGHLELGPFHEHTF